MITCLSSISISDSQLISQLNRGRYIRQMNFEKDGGALMIGRYRALDYFEDGSFYLLDAPGHDVGHMCALVRTTPSTFMFLGGDACHHAAEFRPTEYLPLPNHIPSFKHPTNNIPCPCSFFEQIHPKKSRTKPYYTIAVFRTDNPSPSMSKKRVEVL